MRCQWCGKWIDEGDLVTFQTVTYPKPEIFILHPECYKKKKAELEKNLRERIIFLDTERRS